LKLCRHLETFAKENNRHWCETNTNNNWHFRTKVMKDWWVEEMKNSNSRASQEFLDNWQTWRMDKVAK
jgi:hypothetical protein